MIARTGIRDLDRALQSRCAEFGITRLADTTGLDRTGVPTASCVRPGTGDTIWVYSGKGCSRAEARVTAIMESLERGAFLWSSEAVPVRFANQLELEIDTPVWGPERFTEKAAPYRSETLAWVKARHSSGHFVWVPADLVLTGTRPLTSPASAFVIETSNGMAAHSALPSAIEKAVFELIERHVVSLCELRASHVPIWRLRAICEAIGVDCGEVESSFKEDADVAVSVDLASLPARLKRLFAYFVGPRAGLSLKLLPNSFGLFVAAAGWAEKFSPFVTLGAAGYGISRCAHVAVTKALLELAQSRATDLQGAREDCGVGEKARLSRPPSGHWLLTDSRRHVRLPPARQTGTKPLEVSELDNLLLRGGLREWAFVACSPFPGVHCVRAIIPGVETWHPTGGCATLGPEARRLVGSVEVHNYAQPLPGQ